MHDQTVRFGPGVRARTGAEMAALGVSRALILSTPNQSRLALDLAATLGERAAGVHARAVMHTPADVTVDALERARAIGADCIVAIGGGSAIGLGKALALRTGWPQIAIPTTYAGSEATPILGQTENGLKTTLRDPKVLPATILYDPELIVALPVAISVSSALNAIAHAAEGLYARDRTEETTALALQGLRAFADGLPKVIAAPGDLAARAATQSGAWACGTVLGRVGMALHHKLCHTLGGSFGLPHAETHAVILPHAIAYNAGAVPEALAPIAEIFGGDRPGRSLRAFAASVGAPLALGDLGMAEADLDRCVEIALRNPYWNPAEITATGLRALLQDAWSGAAPRG